MFREGKAFAWYACLSASIALAIATPSIGWETDARTAIRNAQSTGRPLLIVGTLPTCGPCQQMKRQLANNPELQSTLESCVVLVIDADHPDFGKLVRHFGIPVDVVPMIYIVQADGSLTYGQAGALSNDRLVGLLQHAAYNCGQPLDRSTAAELETQLTSVRQLAKDGDLVQALRLLAPVAQRNSTAKVVRQARNYELQLLDAIEDRVIRLDAKIDDPASQYASAYQLISTYVSLPAQFETVRAHIAEVVKARDQNEATHLVVRQAHLLVQAHRARQANKLDMALEHYRSVVKIEPTSRAGKYAAAQLRSM